MKTRTITAICMAVVMVPILIWGNHYHLFDAFGLVLSLCAAYEFRKMFRTAKALPLWVDAITILFTGLVYTLLLLRSSNLLSWNVLIAAILLLLVIYGILLVFVPLFSGADFANALTTILFCSAGFYALALLRTISLNLILYLLLVAMITDMFAYFVGMKFGKHKLIPLVSPKKSVEGAIGGFVFGTIAGSVFGILTQVFGGNFSPVLIVIISILLSILSQIGDLVFSKFKRSYGIKDYSNLFPGHGGVLDRFDSSSFAALALLAIVLLLTDLL
jgi:phosphatidate cytidylyltransferase